MSNINTYVQIVIKLGDVEVNMRLIDEPKTLKFEDPQKLFESGVYEIEIS